MKSVLKWIKYHIDKFADERHSPHYIAIGFSLGSFVNIMLGVIPGLSLVVVLPIMLIFPKINRLAIFVALAAWNIVTLVPIYALGYLTGNFLFGPLPKIDYTSPRELLHLSGDYLTIWLLGTAIVAGAVSIMAYYAVSYMVIWYRIKLAKKISEISKKTR
jgi:uncharacterized protein (DUF2062 family)